tara:strand:- start:157 stop:396 length:240 start_codon:yes stop_codon:yes gene_type:complete
MSDDMIVHITDIDEILENIRVTRDYRLQMSDWTQMPDSPLSAERKGEWAIYRQALRELPQTYADVASLEDVTFPEPPEA